jgi:hypothetical protein
MPRVLLILLSLAWVPAAWGQAAAPSPAPEPAADAHDHHHHHPPPPATGGTAATTPADSRQLDMDGRERSPDTPEIAALKAKFTIDYMLKAGQRGLVFARYIDSLGTQEILDVLEDRNPFCHSEAHELGRAVFAHFKDVGRSLVECGSRCTSACLHGVLKEAFGHSTAEQVRAQLGAVCTTGAMAEIRRPGNCAHGMGHALMMVTENDVERAIDGCADFRDTAMAYYCVTGVYMELFDQGAGQSQGKGAYYPCDAYPRYPAACYRYHGERMLAAADGDAPKAAELCRSLPAAQRRGCFHGLGFAQMALVAREPKLIAAACPAEPAEDRTLCLEGLMERFGAWQPAQALAACDGLEGAAAATCREAASEGMYRLSKPSLPLYVER